MSSHRTPAWMKRDLEHKNPRLQKFEYRGFLVSEDSGRTTIWHVINRLQRGVGLFVGSGSKNKALRWIDSLYDEGRAEGMLWRKPDGWRYDDESHPFPASEGNARMVVNYHRLAADPSQPASHRRSYKQRITEYEAAGGQLRPQVRHRG